MGMPEFSGNVRFFPGPGEISEPSIGGEWGFLHAREEIPHRRGGRELEAALDLNQRLNRLATDLPGGIDDPRWQDFDPAARSALVEIGPDACWAYADRAGAMGLPPSHIRAVAQRATLEAVKALESRLDAEGLLAGPLDGRQRDRIGAIAAEMRAGLGPARLFHRHGPRSDNVGHVARV